MQRAEAEAESKEAPQIGGVGWKWPESSKEMASAVGAVREQVAEAGDVVQGEASSAGAAAESAVKRPSAAAADAGDAAKGLAEAAGEAFGEAVQVNKASKRKIQCMAAWADLHV